MVAADAGPMEIEWGEDSGVECYRDGAVGPADEIGRWRGRNSIAKTLLRKLEEKSCCAARRRGTVHA